MSYYTEETLEQLKQYLKNKYRNGDEYNELGEEELQELNPDKYKCGCGSYMLKKNMKKHFKTKKHNKWITYAIQNDIIQ